MHPTRNVVAGLAAAELTGLHDAALRAWSAAPPHAVEPGGSFESLVLAQHFSNFSLWGLEDEARRRDVTDAVIAEVKRSIDRWNQQRNDLVERIDRALLAEFAGIDTSRAALHSETAGTMIDRLSILALKVWYMCRYAADAADPKLAEECREKAAQLTAQRVDLARCLEQLYADVAAGRRHFKLYRQHKAYNDPRLNPALRSEREIQ